MMDYALEDEIPQEFRGGSLRLSEEEKAAAAAASATATSSTAGDGSDKRNGWKDTFFSPITQKLTETLMPKCQTTASVNPAADQGNAAAAASAATGNNIQSIESIKGGLLETATNFFTFRKGIVDGAAKECSVELIDPEVDGKPQATFLLTEINLWDSDKEKLIILTDKYIFIVKYDFIALKILEHKKIALHELDNIVIGDLIYPSGSMVPRLNGLADGVTNILQTCLFQGWSKTESESCSFHPRDRNMRGARMMWNKGKPLGFSEKWNPFNNTIPFCTLSSHPLYFHEDCIPPQKKLYDLDEFIEKLKDVMGYLEESQLSCTIHHKPIVLQNYVGLSSLIHNRNSLGFFKVRGKFSF
ncbi:PREDICTED: tumor protein p63-regulated gene 1-like protein [Nicrophorus vespilloides]|uniref:Tumor protein p63-regulated gene 1-like protein n=1 Tax=Nicrophorus vespilloides TaxID=110193 RepID=A0ABM1MVX7_NICVS|nr:PREDICTED: tumor protein p63-regulated gene 1-like protein [Nicrophorus vespilloides]